MVRVMASGVFDLVHLGHLYYLMEAKKLGDELVVVVARDNTVRKLKHEPIMAENLRLEMVKGLKPVDLAVLGYSDDPYRIVIELRPDIIALGYDQAHDPEAIQEELEKRGLKVKVVRLPQFRDELNATRKLIRKVVDWWTFQCMISKLERPIKRGDVVVERFRKKGFRSREGIKASGKNEREKRRKPGKRRNIGKKKRGDKS